MQACNSSTGAKPHQIEAGAILRIGQARYDALKNDNTPHKWTHDELRAIRDEYRAKVKAMKREVALDARANSHKPGCMRLSPASQSCTVRSPACTSSAEFCWEADGQPEGFDGGWAGFEAPEGLPRLGWDAMSDRGRTRAAWPSAD